MDKKTVLSYNCSWCNKKYSRVYKYVDHAKKSHNQDLNADVLNADVLKNGGIQPSQVLKNGDIQPSQIVQQTSFSKECNICCENDINAVNDPCGHAIACYSCSSRLRICAVCRKTITKVIKVFAV